MQTSDVVIGMEQNPPNYTSAMNTPGDNIDTPPAYNTLFSQFQRAKEESTNPAEYVLKVFSIICGSILITILFAISSAIPITMIVIGAIYKDKCTIDYKIPIWLIVSGVFGCLSAIVRTIQNCYSIYKKKQDGDFEQSKKSCVSSIIELFIFAWFICGNIWVYSVKSYVSDNPIDSNYCHPTCYYFAFWIITISWILIGLICCCCCCVLILAGCGAGIAALFSSK